MATKDNHHHHHHVSDVSSLKLAFWLNFIFSLLEIYGGYMTNSVAILSDALHDFGDSIALGLAWFLENYSKKNRDSRFAYGYRRFSILSAGINVFILTTGSVFLFWEAIKRLQNPEEVHTLGMIGFAILGLAVNGYGAWKVSKSTSHNHQAVFWHLLEDVLGWAAILIASVVIHFTGYTLLDPLLSALINLFILYNVVKRAKSIVGIFLQRMPDMNYEELKTRIKAIPGVIDIHDIQAWSLDGEDHVISCHIRIPDETNSLEMQKIKKEIKDIFNESHFHDSTIEFEFASESCEDHD